MNLPNKLTMTRIFMTPLFAAMFYLTMIPGNFLIAAGVFALAAFTDFLDGNIARKRNMVTDFGKFLDSIADKILVSTALIVLLVPPTGVTIYYWHASLLVAVIIAREFIISGFRLVAAKKNVVIAADKSGKVKTFFTDLTILFTLVTAFISPEFGVLNIVAYAALCVSTLLTIISGAEYLVKNRQLLSSDDNK